MIRVSNGLSASLQQMISRVEAAAVEGAQQMGMVLDAAIKAEIQGGHKKGTKTGATPGGPPQNITGTLRRSVIATHPRLLAPGHATVTVGPTTVYARAVELGHPRWREGVSYPYVKPGAEHARPQLYAVAVETIDRAIRGR